MSKLDVRMYVCEGCRKIDRCGLLPVIHETWLKLKFSCVEFREGMKYTSVYIPVIDLTIDYMYMLFEDRYQKHRHGNA